MLLAGLLFSETSGNYIIDVYRPFINQFFVVKNGVFIGYEIHRFIRVFRHIGRNVNYILDNACGLTDLEKICGMKWIQSFVSFVVGWLSFLRNFRV